MEILFYLIGISIFMAVLFLLAFFWSVTNGQLDDRETPAIRILFDDKKKNLNPVEGGTNDEG